MCRFFAVMGLLGIFALGGLRAGEEENKNEKRVRAAEKLIKSKDYESALLILESVLAEEKEGQEPDPLVTEALCNKAVILEQQGKTPDALAAYNRCLERIQKQPESIEGIKLAEKCKKAILELDKSRQIILRHAEQIEREAARFKDKDDYAYARMMEVVVMMRGAWNETESQAGAEGASADGKAGEKENGDGKDKSGNKRSDKADAEMSNALRTRFRELYGALAAGQLDKAVPYVDPEIRRAAGEGLVKVHLNIVHAFLKAGQVQANDVSVREVTLGESREDARVIGRLRLATGLKDMDPNYWVLRDGEWYLGDEKKLQTFK